MDFAASVSSRNDEKLSEYERQRLRNMADMNLLCGDFIDIVSNSAQDLASALSGPVKKGTIKKGTKRSRNYLQLDDATVTPKKGIRTILQAVRRSKRVNGDRNDYNENSGSEDDGLPSKLKVKFPFKKIKPVYKILNDAYYSELNDNDFISDEEYYINPRSKRGRGRKVVPVSKITQAMLDNIAYTSTNKCYNSVTGTTCHQCRQKTTDQKSYCRYKNCSGGRGMFCGFCLGKRYGEDLAEVLLNKKWACPSCRMYCNCSICRRKNGQLPTGPMVKIALENRYNSVREMLEDIEGEYQETNLGDDFYGSDEEDEEDTISEDINLDKDVFKIEQRYNVVSEIKHLPIDFLNFEIEYARLYEQEYGQKMYP